MISNRCARKSLVTNCNSIISKNYLRFLVDSNEGFPYFSNGLQLFYLFLHTHGKQKNVRSHTLMVNKSGGKTTFYIKLHPLMPSCPH